MQSLSHDELCAIARPTHDHLDHATRAKMNRALTQLEVTQLVRRCIAPIVPIHLCYAPGPSAALALHLEPLPFLNVRDMMEVLPPVMLVEFKGGTTKPMVSVSNTEYERTHRDVAPFYIHAEYDYYGYPKKGTAAEIYWWSYMRSMIDSELAMIRMPLSNVESYLICDYATESIRSKKVSLNSMRTTLSDVQVTSYSGADRNSPLHWYIHWDMKTTINHVLETIQERFHVCQPIN